MEQIESTPAAVEAAAFKVKSSIFACPSTKFPEDATVTMAYVPYQLDRTAYKPEEALQIGTLFCSLNKPFTGRSNLNE